MPSLLGLQVEGNPALARVEVEEEQAVFGAGLVMEKWRHPPGRVSLRPLHLDNFGAVIGQQLGAPRAGDVMGEVKYLHPFKSSRAQGNLHVYERLIIRAVL